MKAVVGCRPRDVKSPVRAGNFDGNGIRVSFFNQRAYEQQLPEALSSR